MSKQEKIPGVIQFPAILRCSPQAEGPTSAGVINLALIFKRERIKRGKERGRERERKRRARGRERKDTEDGGKVLT